MLLTDVDDKILRKDLKLKVLGQRSFVKDAITQLRTRSLKYQEYISAHHTSYQDQNIAALVNPLLNGLRASIYPNSPGVTASPGQIPFTPADIRDSDSAFVFDDTGNKRRRLNIAGDHAEHALHPEVESPLLLENGDVPSPRAEPPSIPIRIVTKAHKRIAPTWVRAVADPDRDRFMPTAADYVIRNDPNLVEPGVTFVGDDGKKRMVPVHQTAKNEKPFDYQDLLRKPDALDEGGEKGLKAAQQLLQETKTKELQTYNDSFAVGYLGRQSMRVDDLFYGDVPIGKDFDSAAIAVEFAENANISSGRRLYVHHAIKHFLQSERQVFNRKGKFFSAIRPYNVQLIPPYQKPSFTLYYSDDEGIIHARRADQTAWPEVDPDAFEALNDGQVTTFATASNEPIVPYEERYDPDVLTRYLYVPGGDESLPPYGESDEENDFEVDTWNEILKENQNVTGVLLSLKKPKLAPAQVEQAIDEGIAEMVVAWHKDKKPKRECKAYGLWKKFHQPVSQNLMLPKRWSGLIFRHAFILPLIHFHSLLLNNHELDYSGLSFYAAWNNEPLQSNS